jgi:hypothetical protein
MTIKNQKDFLFGLMFIVFGTAYAVGATRYEVGTAAQMGPGYFPLVLGILMALVGIFVAGSSFVVVAEDGGKVGKWAWRPLFFIVAANFAFGISLGGLPLLRIPAFGMIIGVYVLTFVASMASDEFDLKEVTILATVLALICYACFVMLLSLPFPVWPEFLVK